MTELPSTLRQSIPPELEFEANRWWNELSEIDRADLRRLCDARKEAFLFETFDPNNDQQKIAVDDFSRTTMRLELENGATNTSTHS